VKQLKLKATVKSPVFVWAGEMNSGIVQPWSWRTEADGKVRIVPEELAIEAWQAEANHQSLRILNMYLRAIQNDSDNDTGKKPPDFRSLRMLRSALPNLGTILESNGLSGALLDLWRFSHSMQQPFLPASTIKGAFRLALLINILMNEKPRRLQFVKTNNKIEFSILSEDVKPKDIDAILFRYMEFKTRNNSDSNAQLKRESQIIHDPFRQLIIQDVDICLQNLEVRECEVWSARTQGFVKTQQARSMCIESLKVNSSFEIDVRFQPLGNLMTIEFDHLLDALKTHYSEVIRREKLRLKTLTHIDSPILSSLGKFYKCLEDEIAKGAIPLRLGMGVGEDSKSITRLYKPEVHQYGITPRSRRLCRDAGENHLPMGWILLERVQT
jgi:hypothetical protein